jgi:hypothetical protein
MREREFSDSVAFEPRGFASDAIGGNPEAGSPLRSPLLANEITTK